jgi:murein DD-endopeptidase MepM/ murein hydrolase activator NlpD
VASASKSIFFPVAVRGTLAGRARFFGMAGSLCLVLVAFNCDAQVTGRAAPHASVAIPQLGLHTIADDSGRFVFDSVIDGRWGVESHNSLGLATVRGGIARVSMSMAPSAPADCAGGGIGGVATSPLVLWPAQPVPGSLIELTATDRSARAISGLVAGELVRFWRDTGDTWIALAGVPLDAGKTISAHLTYGAAKRDTAFAINAEPIIARAAAPREKLRVAAQFSRPATTDVSRRIAGESELAREVGAIAVATPPLWREAFQRPRNSVITSGFASGRKFNGTLNSRHTGVDFRGAVGDTVRATNRGVVALVADFYLAGTVVYIVHGAGLASGYFHLSQTDVAIGDTVQRGQVIGRVGQSGRVTGPHLHWIIRYDHTTVDPMGVLSLGWIPRDISSTCRGSDSPAR